MQVFDSKGAARQWVRSRTREGRSVGLIPTMGALHEGHYSLVRRSRQQCDATIATIFVNPTQFGPDEDLSRYPRTLDDDLAGLRRCGADAVFVPEGGAMYREAHSTFVDPPAVALPLEGVSRPGHFRGVCTIVLKLMHVLPATHAFFGQKDFQQSAVIRAMVEDLDVAMEIEVCEIIRDRDGLALSSRNRYLSVNERLRALALPRALAEAERLVASGETRSAMIESGMRCVLAAAPVEEIQYATLADPRTLAPVAQVDRPTVALIAARVGQTRLIDNRILNPVSAATRQTP